MDALEANRLREANLRLQTILDKIKRAEQLTAKERNEIVILLAARRMKLLLAAPAEALLDSYHGRCEAELAAWTASNPAAATATAGEVSGRAREIWLAGWGLESLRNTDSLPPGSRRDKLLARILENMKVVRSTNPSSDNARKADEKRRKAQSELDAAIAEATATLGLEASEILQALAEKKIELIGKSGDSARRIMAEIDRLSFAAPADKWETMRLSISKQLAGFFKPPCDMAGQDLSNVLSVLEAMLPADHPAKAATVDDPKRPGAKTSLLKLMRRLRDAKSHSGDFTNEALVEHVAHIVAFLEAMFSSSPGPAGWRDQFKDLDVIPLKQALEAPSVSDDILKQSLEPRPIFSHAVPQINANFTGRADVLERIHSAFSAQRPPDLAGAEEVQVITQAMKGLGGIGKTGIAVQYCHQYKSFYKETGERNMCFYIY